MAEGQSLVAESVLDEIRKVKGIREVRLVSV